MQKWNIPLQLPRPLPLSHLPPQSFHKLLWLKNSLGNERSWWRSQRQTSNDLLVRVDFKLAKNISWTPSIVARYISRHRGSSPSSPQKAPHHPQAERLLWVELWKWSQFLAFERSTALESRTQSSGPEAEAWVWVWSRHWKWSQVLLSSFWASRNAEVTIYWWSISPQIEHGLENSK